MTKMSTKFDRGHPLRGRQTQVWVGKNRRRSTNNSVYLENDTK